MNSDISLAIYDFVEVLNRHSIKYVIGGSISSSLNGIFRSTNDIDVVIENLLGQTPRTLEELGGKFLIDSEALLKNHRENRAYNLFPFQI